jgi:hypothetical protein
VLSGGNHERVVLHHHHGVGARRQLAEDRDQPLGVARVEACGGLVEHVERVGEVRAERVRELDALGLAARERAREPVEREVAQVHAEQEAEPRFQLHERRAGDRPFGLAELEPARKPAAEATLRAQTWAMLSPPSVTRSASGRSRAPPQPVHGRGTW